ncbi:MAG TPA: DUF2569 domain-containing protein [Nordella sp.]|nr:DUF2569 domain-containing protein [Nordella sp.]
METTSGTATQTSEVATPKGLGGWLILPIIHLILTVVMCGYTVFDWTQDWDSFVAIVTGEVDPEFTGLIWPLRISLVLSAALVAFALYLLVILFQKKRALPQLMVWFYFVLLGGTLIVSGMILQNPQHWTSTDVAEARRALGQNVFAAIIWIPYFLRSKRVKATFVN